MDARAVELFKSVEKSLEKIALDPKYHDVLALIKAVRNGAVYGTKIRFPHALVMVFLFRSGTIREKVWLVFKATRQHARNLAVFALIYKTACYALLHLNGKEQPFDTFMAGLLGGYVVFGRYRGAAPNSVAQQIVIYVFARVMLALAKLAVQPRDVYSPTGGGPGLGLLDWNPQLREASYKHGWPVFAALSWAGVMYLFRWHPETIQSSLRSSMTYM